MILDGRCDNWHGVQSALATIRRTSELAALLADRYLEPVLSRAIRNNEHLK